VFLAVGGGDGAEGAVSGLVGYLEGVVRLRELRRRKAYGERAEVGEDCWVV